MHVVWRNEYHSDKVSELEYCDLFVYKERQAEREIFSF